MGGNKSQVASQLAVEHCTTLRFWRMTAGEELPLLVIVGLSVWFFQLQYHTASTSLCVGYLARLQQQAEREVLLPGSLFTCPVC